MNKLYVVGIGAGSLDGMTFAARAVLDDADILCGYTGYIALLREAYPEKQIIETPMKQETERCRMALEQASLGGKVAVVCSGDAGVYGMASLIYQLAEEYPTVEIEIVSGVTAAVSGAAVLGAPIGHDFAVISLSDLLTPWQVIEKRLAACSSADMAICLYNPSSTKRADYLKRACEIVLQHQSPQTVCGYVKNIGRDGQEHGIMTLSELKTFAADMFTTVFIGNSSTIIKNGKMITPRGYLNL